MGKRIVIALGGNALGNNLPEQMTAVRQTAKAIVDLIQEGHEVILSHGNGPQVGMIQKAMQELTRSDPEKYIPCPLSVCVAMRATSATTCKTLCGRSCWTVISKREWLRCSPRWRWTAPTRRSRTPPSLSAPL